jgi:formate-dependent nitrite reductase membrane component NrfD
VRTSTGYYGLPVLKKPVWSSGVPLYMFVGGAAGAAALIALGARATSRDQLARDARWIAAGGALVSTGLLIEDLGRPTRFLNMLRVFKPQSPMSVGSWTLAAFGAATFAGLVAAAAPSEVRGPGSGAHASVLRRVASAACDLAAAATGLVMTTYTGVLLGVTAIPVWSEHVDVLPAHFGASALASATSLLNLRGHDDPALNHLATAAALAETLLSARVELGESKASRPLKSGVSGWLVRGGSLLSGPVPVALRVAGRRRRALRLVAACSALAGSLLTRFGWVKAGSASAEDPSIPLKLR